MMRRLPPFLVLALVTVACPEPRRDRPVDSLLCSDGFIDDGGTCVPEACGSGIWGDLELDGTTVHVDAAAAEGGNGSAEAPLRSIQSAVDLAGSAGGGMVAVAAGTYPEALMLGSGHSGVRLVGRCRDLVVLDARTGDDRTAGIHIDAPGQELQVSGLTVQGADYCGLLVAGGSVLLEDSDILENAMMGVIVRQDNMPASELVVRSSRILRNVTAGIGATDGGSRVELHDTVIADTQVEGGYCVGMTAFEGATIEAWDSLLEGNSYSGAYAEGRGTQVVLHASTIRDTAQAASTPSGWGITAANGGSVSADACLLTGNTTSGIGATGEGATVTLRGCTIRNSRCTSSGDGGFGIEVNSGATLWAEDTLFEDNLGAGVVVVNEDSEATLIRTVISNTAPNDAGAGGFGVQVNDGATLNTDACLVTHNTGFGVGVAEPGSRAELLDTTISDTRPDEDGGQGLMVFDEAFVLARSCMISSNTMAGVTLLYPRTRTLLQDCQVVDTQPHPSLREGLGASAQDGAELVIQSSEISRNNLIGVAAGGFGARLELEGTSIRGTLPDEEIGLGYGLQLYGGAEARIDGCEISGNTTLGVMLGEPGTHMAVRDSIISDTQLDDIGTLGYGVQVSNAGGATLEGCELSGNLGVGLFSYQRNSTIELRDTTVRDTRRNLTYALSAGLCTQDGGAIDATRLEVYDTEGPALYCHSEGSRITCRDSLFSGSRYAGAVTTDGGLLELEGSTVEGTAPGPDVGGGLGLYASPWFGEPPTVTVSDSFIQDNPVAGAWFSGEGSYTLQNNDISGGSGEEFGAGFRCGNAVFVDRGIGPQVDGAGMLLQGNSIHSGQEAGLFLADASATLDGNTWSGNPVDLIRQGESCAEPPEGYDTEPLADAELCPTWDYATCTDIFVMRLEVAELDQGRGRVQPAPLSSAVGFTPHAAPGPASPTLLRALAGQQPDTSLAGHLKETMLRR